MTKSICEIGASGWFYYKEICCDARSHVTMHGHMTRCTVKCHFARSHEGNIPSLFLFATGVQVYVYGERLATRAICQTMTVTSCSAIALHMQQSLRLGFRPFVITHFNASLSAFREWFRRIEERQHG